jgi:hypothetical protein
MAVGAGQHSQKDSHRILQQSFVKIVLVTLSSIVARRAGFAHSNHSFYVLGFTTIRSATYRRNRVGGLFALLNTFQDPPNDDDNNTKPLSLADTNSYDESADTDKWERLWAEGE